MNEATLRQLDRLIDQLNSEEQAVLIEGLAQRLRQRMRLSEAQPQDLYGIWKGKFPEDIDLDSALREIRQGWNKEWTNKGEFVE
jgi:hypothetical protein